MPRTPRTLLKLLESLQQLKRFKICALNGLRNLYSFKNSNIVHELIFGGLRGFPIARLPYPPAYIIYPNIISPNELIGGGSSSKTWKPGPRVCTRRKGLAMRRALAVARLTNTTTLQASRATEPVTSQTKTG